MQRDTDLLILNVCVSQGQKHRGGLRSNTVEGWRRHGIWAPVCLFQTSKGSFHIAVNLMATKLIAIHCRALLYLDIKKTWICYIDIKKNLSLLQSFKKKLKKPDSIKAKTPRSPGLFASVCLLSVKCVRMQRRGTAVAQWVKSPPSMSASTLYGCQFES